MNDYIGISEDRLRHILGVARECYQIAKDMGKDETFCRIMFFIGWNHDIGYEFSTMQEEHPKVGAEMFRSAVNGHKVFSIDEFDLIHTPAEAVKNYKAIYQHGSNMENQTIEWRILNMADMKIDSKGNKVNVTQRLEDIKNRYGEHSDQYLTACDIAVRVGLIDRDSVNRDQFGE